MTDTSPSRKELFEAANMLRKNCDNARNCLDCAFSKNSWGGCALSKTPANWHTFKESPWSAADVQMAKALKAYGYTHMRHDDCRAYALIIHDNHTERLTGINKDSFINAEPYKVYNLNDIIAEGANIQDKPKQVQPTLSAEQLGLSDIEIQLLKLCKLLGLKRIEVRESLGSVFSVAYGNKEYHIWR